MTFYKDMCIICFSPTKSNFNKLYGLRVYGRQDAIVSELGIIYQDLFQISLQLSDTHPMYVCNVCKKEILRFNELKKQALENYKKIIGEPEKTSELSTPSEINTANEINEATTLGETSESSEHLKRVEEITVFDISTRQTEKFEIQFLDDDSDQNHIDISNNEEEEGGVLHDIIEIEDSKSHLEGLINTTTNGTIDNQDDGLSNKIGYNAMLQIKCQLCGKQFDTNDEFNTHWSEHMPHYRMNYESPEERKLRMARERQKRWRDRHKNDVKRLLQQNAEYKRRRRLKEEPEESQARRARCANRIRQSRAIRRAIESEEEAAERRQREAERVRQRRAIQQAQETEAQAKARRQRESDKRRQRRAKQKVQEGARDQKVSANAADRKSKTPSDLNNDPC